MPAKTKPKPSAIGVLRNVTFYPDDDERVERIRERLERRGPPVKGYPAIVRWAIAFADEHMSSK